MRLLATRTTADEWFELQLDCVLLENGRCAAYDLRPTGCRTLFALETSERCAYGADDPNVVRVNLGEVSKHSVGNLMVLAHELRLPIAQLPLPLALQWALIVVERGLDALRAHLAGTVFEDDLRTVVHWTERFHGPSAIRGG
ncbi:MAG: hypothetical protein SFX73_38060 [Kofleriaceae bacterium]|nr:hypothetical protein [Kofleriaceae bacterium]